MIDGYTSLVNRFNAKYVVDLVTGCWNWIGSKDIEGYGVIWDKRKDNNSRAHRISLEIAGVEIPDGLICLHQCDNKSCVNPNHIKIGTSQETQIEARDRGLLDNVPSKRKLFIQQMSDDEFSNWLTKFEGKTGKQISNRTSAIKWRREAKRI